MDAQNQERADNRPTRSEKKQSAGRSKKASSRKMPGKGFINRFQWDEVDDDSEQVDITVVPVKKPKNRRRKGASASTVAEQYDSPDRDFLPPKKHVDDGYALPSYGSILPDDDDDLGFDFNPDDFDDEPEETEVKPAKQLEKSGRNRRGRSGKRSEKTGSRNELPREKSVSTANGTDEVEVKSVEKSRGRKQANRKRGGSVADQTQQPVDQAKVTVARESLASPGSPSRTGSSAEARTRRKGSQERKKMAVDVETLPPTEPGQERQEMVTHVVKSDVEVDSGAVEKSAPPATVSAKKLHDLKWRATKKLRFAGFAPEKIAEIFDVGKDATSLLLYRLCLALLEIKPASAGKVTGQEAASLVPGPDLEENMLQTSVAPEPVAERSIAPAKTEPLAPTKVAAKDIPLETGEKQTPRSAGKPKKTDPRPTRPEPQKRPQVQEQASVTPDETDDEAASHLSFGELPISLPMLRILHETGYENPTPVQAGTFQRVMAGVDLIGQAKTGTGKTAAFVIPVLEKVEDCPPGNDPVALIIVPTRELAVQVRDEAMKLVGERDIIVTACYGGKPIASQIQKLRGGVDIVVGTPGRIIDLVARRALSFQSLQWVILDEADRMLDIGFRPDIEKILRQTPSERQTLLFSATLPAPVVQLAKRYMRDPEQYDFSAQDISSETIEQFYLTVDKERKFEALITLLEREKPQQAIVFCRTKRAVDRIGTNLKRTFDGVAAIHGDLSQDQRDKIMKNFRSGNVAILVATDVVGRGIDVSGISHIINYDIPQFCDDYVHRVGRTGRMGREGVAYSLVTSQEGAELTRIEKRINRLLKRTELPGFEAYTKPESHEEEEEKQVKPVFGKSVRRIRRAL
ncbi:MAG: DEAD/DEAH box helicase [Planctomycetia bacterium]|nr:DEAD/DEAH box helicase [Planctomycetia bacterium]